MKEPFLYKLVDEVIAVSGEAYPELVEKAEYIKKVIRIEEEKFNETIDKGSEILASYIEELKSNNEKTLSGENAFRLYDTYGFPVDLTKEILEEEHLEIDEEGFQAEMEKQRQTARDARGNMDSEAWKEDAIAKLDKDIVTDFEGYETLSIESTVKGIAKENELVKSASVGDEVIIVLDKTAFYPEGGGQVGDKGLLVNKNEDVVVEVIDTKKGPNNTIKHICVVKSGMINVGDVVYTKVDKEVRLASARNHSATHILHKVLKEVLGEHVNQAGSLVTPERLRFDVTHFEAISKDELKVIEEKVNDMIFEALDITCENMV
ncbi:tRNA synthetases class II family protein [[Clostridium] sordellii ATCC 9714]|nr:tRNA synthetases class II family protein [[Clostridium] sordellii ATCC 9714] [Paeniclostridium sordellii ATCC 9714]